MIDSTVFRERRGVPAFALGCVAVTMGGLLHIPMYWMGKDTGFVLADMSMDNGMIFGMALIVAGLGTAAYGLLPKSIGRQLEATSTIAVTAPEDAALGRAHFGLMAALAVALIIDVMKPASLGFIMPGMIAEYGITKAEAALVPFFALTGTVVGSVLWGILSDVYGRKASILLSAVVFVGMSRAPKYRPIRSPGRRKPAGCGRSRRRTVSVAAMSTPIGSARPTRRRPKSNGNSGARSSRATTSNSIPAASAGAG